MRKWPQNKILCTHIAMLVASPARYVTMHMINLTSDPNIFGSASVDNRRPRSNVEPLACHWVPLESNLLKAFPADIRNVCVSACTQKYPNVRLFFLKRCLRSTPDATTKPIASSHHMSLPKLVWRRVFEAQLSSSSLDRQTHLSLLSRPCLDIYRNICRDIEVVSR